MIVAPPISPGAPKPFRHDRRATRLRASTTSSRSSTALLKNPEIGAELADRGVNVSLAMTLADGVRAYLKGDKKKALLEPGTATDEIAARMTLSGEAKS